MPSGGCGRGAQYRVVYNVRDLLVRKFWMKRYFVFLLLIFAFPASASEAFTPAPLNPDFIRWRVSARNEARGADVMSDAGSSAVVPRGGGSGSARYIVFERRRFFDAPGRSPAPSAVNHSVAIVGWDDGYPRENFVGAKDGEVPDNNGAWLIRDSYGSGPGGAHGDGYFYVSYEEGSFSDACVFVAGWYAAAEDVYEYDPLGSVRSFGLESETAWGANVFTARRGGRISAVSFWAKATGTSYEVTVETGLREGSSRGTAAASVSGVTALPGYMRPELPSPVYVGAGEKFSVVLKFTTPGYNFPLAYEYAADDYSEKAVNNPGQSLYSADGEIWKSMVERGDLCIKAYVTPERDGGGCGACGGCLLCRGARATQARLTGENTGRLRNCRRKGRT